MEIKIFFYDDEYEEYDVGQLLNTMGFQSWGFSENEKTRLCERIYKKNPEIINLQTLKRVRNKLNRQIATLKKANLNE